MLDAGLVRICSLQSINENGGMPQFSLVEQFVEFYQERTLGVTRLYAALGVNRQVDMLIRIWENGAVLPEMYCVLEDGSQFRISQVQHLRDEYGLKVSDITLERLGTFYDID